MEPTPAPPIEPAPLVTVTPSVRTAAGTPVTVQVTVTNRAAAARDYSVLAVGGDAGWLPAPLRVGPVEPAASTTLEVELRPAVGTLPARYPLAVAVQALDPTTGRSTPASSATADTVLVVSPRSRVSLTVDPSEVRATRGARLRVGLHNHGSEAVRLRLMVQCSGSLRVRLSQETVTVPAGQQRRITGHARFGRVRLVGEPLRYGCTVAARGSEAIAPIDVAITQRAVLGAGLMRVAALATVLAIWVAAAVVFIPMLAQKLQGPSQVDSVEVAQGPTGGADAEGDGGSEGAGGAGGSGDGSNAGTGGGTEAEQALQLSGTVVADDPAGVTVTLAPTSLVDEDAQGAIPVGSAVARPAVAGMRARAALLTSVPGATASQRSARTTKDGAWAFPAVTAPGYYLLSFSKAGYQTRRYVVNSEQEIARESLEVELAPGQGRLTGRINGPGGPARGATVRITDGTNTISTSSNSRGDAGAWAVDGLSTPGTYIVEASSNGLSMESRVVELGAGGAARADLTLRRGVATLVGRAKAKDRVGEMTGAGGVTVTVSDGEGAERAVTTLTSGVVGRYTVPGLPVPGTYTVSLSREGLQTQTHRLRLGPKDSRAVVNAELEAASGVLYGHVFGEDGRGLVGAGMVLTNEQETYKTTSLSSPRGNYRFNGVAPGTYTLSTQIFGYVTDHVTVRVRAGNETSLDRDVGAQEGGVLPASSKIQGRAIDARHGQEITCPGGPTEECLSATVLEPDPDPDKDPTEYTVAFNPREQYTLPELDDQGLRAGLKTVEIAATGYESVRVRVEVPLGDTVTAPLARLYPAPKVHGSITTAVGKPVGPTCVWAIPEGTDPATPPACDATTPPAACTSDIASYDPRAPRRDGTCALVKGSGDYEITVPAHGIYAMYVQPSDPEYLDAPQGFVNLPQGATQAYDARLNRLGRLSVLVLKPGSNGDLVVAPDVEVEVAPEPAIAWLKTGTAGTTSIKGLAAGSYQLTAADGANNGSVNVFVGLNEELPVALPLTDPITSLVGRAVGNLDGAAVSIDGADVEMQVVDGYFGVSPVRSALLLTTRGDGCFAVESTEPPGDLPDCPAPWNAGPSLKQHDVLSATAGLVRIRADGYETLSRSPAELSTTDVNTFTLNPVPISFSATMRTNPVAAAAWPDVRFQVSPAAGPTTAISLRAEADPLDPTLGRLVWNDSRLSGAGLVRPGNYDITASLAGYDDDTATLKCAVNGSCAWEGDPLVLPQLGQLSVSAQRSGGAAVNGAVFELRRAGAVVQTLTPAANQNSVTFTGLKPSETRYGVRVRGAGHEFRTVGDGTAGCGASTTITIAPAATTTCAVDLTPLGTITGKVTGVLATDPLPPNPDTRDLAGAAVTVQRCSATTTIADTLRCTAVSSTAGDTFSAVTDDLGTFSATGSTTHEGLKAGTWLVTATAAGFTSPSATGYLPGTAVVLEAGLGTVTGNVTLYVVPVAVQVKVEDSKGKALKGVALEMLRDGASVAVATQSGSGANVVYKFGSVVPGHYTLRASGSSLITTTMQIHVLSAPATQSFVMPVGLGSSTLSGKVTETVQVTETGPATPLAGVKVFLECADAFTGDVCLEDEGDPAGVEGTDGAVVTTLTDAQGAFLFQNIPNGQFEVHFSKADYHDEHTESFTFSHTNATPLPLAVSLDPVTRNVELTVTSAHTGDTSRMIKLTLTQGSRTLTTDALASGGTNVYTTTLNQVRAGCWTVTASTLSPGSGVLGDVTNGGSAPVCAAGEVAVPGDSADTTAATAALTLRTGLLQVTPAALPLDGHSAPDAQLTVTGPGAAGVVSGAAALDSTLDLWVVPGTYTAVLAAVPASVFWPSATAAVEVASGGTEVLTPTLEEVTGELVVDVEGLADGQEAQITLTRGPGQDAAVPAGYSTGVTTTDGSFTFALPSGAWVVEVTAAGFEVESDDVTVTQLTQTHPVVLTQLPPPTP